MRVLVIGLTRELPISPTDSLDIADKLVARAANAHTEGAHFMYCTCTCTVHISVPVTVIVLIFTSNNLSRNIYCTCNSSVLIGAHCQLHLLLVIFLSHRYQSATFH